MPSHSGGGAGGLLCAQSTLAWSVGASHRANAENITRSGRIPVFGPRCRACHRSRCKRIGDRRVSPECADCRAGIGVIQKARADDRGPGYVGSSNALGSLTIACGGPAVSNLHAVRGARHGNPAIRKAEALLSHRDGDTRPGGRRGSRARLGHDESCSTRAGSSHFGQIAMR